MAKRGRVESSLVGLRALADAVAVLRGGRVDVGFFAGEAARTDETPAKAAARARRRARVLGEGSKPGFYKQGVAYAKNRAALGDGEDEAMTNPQLAAKHEFGVGVPTRSMLRMPFHLHGDRVLKDAKADARVQLAQVARAPRRTAQKILDRVGIAGENLVQEAFATRGFGSWRPNAPLTIELKGSDAPLIDTAQLWRAVDSRAVL